MRYLLLDPCFIDENIEGPERLGSRLKSHIADKSLDSHRRNC